MADKKSNDKSTWLFRPASPDSLSKKLKKCKTRKERQMAVFNDNFEREERRRMERATMEAEQAAKQAQIEAEKAAAKAVEDAAQAEELRKEWSEFWTDEWMEYVHQHAREEQKKKASQLSVRPKTVRPERAVLTKPEEPKLMTYMYKKYPGLDKKKILIERVPGGVQYTANDGLIPGAYVGDKFFCSDKWLIYQQLKEMDLEDPEVQKAITKACSTPEKEEKQEEKPSENCSEEKKIIRKKLFKK